MGNHESINFLVIKRCYYNGIKDPEEIIEIGFSKAKRFFYLCLSDESRMYKIEESCVLGVDNVNKELFKYTKPSDMFYSIKTYIENMVEFLPVYGNLVLKLSFSTLYDISGPITKQEDSSIGFLGKTPMRMLYNKSSEQFDIPLQYECCSWFNKHTFQLDSVVAYNITDNDFREVITYCIQGINFDDKDAYYDSVFNFNNSIYCSYSKHDEGFLPYSMSASSNYVLSNDLLQYLILNTNNDSTNLASLNCWVLLDLWQFGCSGCYQGFDKLKNEKTDLGYRILEREGIRIMAVNALSDNVDLINKVADKFDNSDILYFSKGINTKLALVNFAYPSYYLISPEKEIIWRSNYLGDYSSLFEAKVNYEKQHLR